MNCHQCLKVIDPKETYLTHNLTKYTYHEHCFRDLKMEEYLNNKSDSERKKLERKIKCRSGCGKEAPFITIKWEDFKITETCRLYFNCGDC